MSDLFQQLERNQAVEDAAGGQMFGGTIISTAGALTDAVTVVLDQLDPLATTVPAGQWSPRVVSATVNVAETGEIAHNITVAHLVLPANGGRCLIGFDDSGTAWILAWGAA